MQLPPLLLLSLSTTGPRTPQRTPAEANPPTHLFLGGLGYCGARIAAAFHEAYPECRVSATVRSAERRESLLGTYGPCAAATGLPSWLDVHVLDLDGSYTGLDSAGLGNLTAASHVVQTVAPVADFDRDPLLALHGAAIAESASAGGKLRWVGYLSSTGVYGGHSGDWVDEESELRCVDAKSRARVKAEREWSQLEQKSGRDGPRVDSFRCGGIYGPGRGPLFLSPSALRDEGERGGIAQSRTVVGTPKYINRILVDDICGALLAAVASDRPRMGGRAYNLVDDDPAPRIEVVEKARRLLGLKTDGGAPRRANDGGGASRSRSTGNKRCSNRRLREEYGWEPLAPTYREGLAYLLEKQKRT